MTPPSPSGSSTSSARKPSQPQEAAPEATQDPTPSPPPPSPLFLPASPPRLPLDQSPLSSESPDESPSHVGDDPASASPPPSIGKAKLRELRDVARRAVETIGGVAHQLLTREDTPERQVALYVPDAEDVEAISEPLAGLASRRLPEGPENPDIADLIKLGVGLLGYALKQRIKRSQVARMYAEAARQVSIDHDDQGDDAFPPPADG